MRNCLVSVIELQKNWALLLTLTGLDSAFTQAEQKLKRIPFLKTDKGGRSFPNSLFPFTDVEVFVYGLY